MCKRFIQNRWFHGAVVLAALVALASCGSGKSAPAGAAGGSSNGTAPSASSATAAPASAPSLKPYTGSEKILAFDAAAKSVTINLIAAENGTADGFNFNGYAKGAMDIKVPTGWTVTISLTVASSTAHSALIVPYAERFSSLLHPSFPGSASPDYRGGISKGQPAQQFSFTAGKAGSYAIVCGVPGHDNLGMWDGFDVVDGLAEPQLLVAG